MLFDGVLDSFPRCPSQHLEDLVGWRSENLDSGCGVQRVFVGASGALADHPHMKLKGVSIGMDLHDRHLCPFVIDILVKCDEAGLIGFDEVNQSRDTSSLSLQLSSLESVRR